MIPEAYPQTGFLKWVTTILSTTQVTQNVILMALSFIHRLKKLNPTVRGKLGSEYRLLTVALMLGNKCKIPRNHEKLSNANHWFSSQSLMTILTQTRLGPKFPAFQFTKFM